MIERAKLIIEIVKWHIFNNFNMNQTTKVYFWKYTIENSRWIKPIWCVKTIKSAVMRFISNQHWKYYIIGQGKNTFFALSLKRKPDTMFKINYFCII